MSKGPDAFRTISEVAAELNLPQHVLRFWETRFSQIKPLKRGGGRRYYRPDDVDLLRGIRHLLYGEGYTIRGVQRILKEQGPRFAIAAGRGALNGPSPPQLADGVGEFAEEDEAMNGADAPFHEAATVHGVAHAGPPNGGGAARDGARRLTGDERDRLQTTLSELLELKRLLDQTR